MPLISANKFASVIFLLVSIICPRISNSPKLELGVVFDFYWELFYAVHHHFFLFCFQ